MFILLFFGSFFYFVSSQTDICKVENVEDWTEEQLVELFPDYPGRERSYGAAFGAKFRNFLNIDLDLYWDNGSRGVYNGVIRRNAESATNTYHGHEFFFTERGNKKEIYRFQMDKDKVNYWIPPPDETPGINKKFDEYLKKIEELQEYRKSTGRHWQSPYGRPPPQLFMWDASHVGQAREITSKYRHFHCLPENESEEAIKKCQTEEDLIVTIVVTSLEPLAFYIKGLLSEWECDHIVELGKPTLRQSMTGTSGGFKSESRTSATTWIGSSRTIVMGEIYKRAANVLNLDEDILKESKNAESLQFVHYLPGQFYQAHHDFGSQGEGFIKSRYITLLLYLNERPEGAMGGETGFPKARNGKGMLAYPPKGDSMMFYNILPDGNYDDKALHEARAPRGKWEKYLCNFWIWDPKR